MEGRDSDDIAYAIQRDEDNRKTFRGRRMRVCTSIDEVLRCIDQLGVDTTSERVELPAAPSDAQKRELKNQARVLLRTFLLWNDGHVSDDELRGF